MDQEVAVGSPARIPSVTGTVGTGANMGTGGGGGGQPQRGGRVPHRRRVSERTPPRTSGPAGRPGPQPGAPPRAPQRADASLPPRGSCSADP